MNDSMTEGSALPKKGYFLVIVAAVLWAVSGSSGKFLFHRGVTPAELVQLRLTLSTVLLFFWLLIKDRQLLKIFPRDIFYFLVLGTAGMAMVQYTYFHAISKIHVAVAILLQYLAPLFIALHAVLLARERLTRPTLIALAGSTFGCYLVAGAYNFNLLTMNLEGIAFGIASGIAFAWYAIQGERGMRRYNPWTVLFYALFFASLFWNLAIFPLKAFQRPYGMVEWAWMGYIVIFGTIVPYWLYSEGISLIRATRASVTATLEPITAAFISFFFLGEILEPLQMLGGGLVILSVILLQLKREHDENTPVLIRARQKLQEMQEK